MAPAGGGQAPPPPTRGHAFVSANPGVDHPGQWICKRCGQYLDAPIHDTTVATAARNVVENLPDVLTFGSHQQRAAKLLDEAADLIGKAAVHAQAAGMQHGKFGWASWIHDLGDKAKQYARQITAEGRR